MYKSLLQVSCIFFIVSFSISKNKYEWKSRSVIQLLTDRFARDSDDDKSDCILADMDYCKGTYKGILNHLDYIENLGFDAIWISPVIENIDKSYHGYHFKNLYKLNENFGKEEDLRALIDECHRRDIWVMVDVVANHAGPLPKDSQGKEDFSIIHPFNQEKYYHTHCDIGPGDWDTNQQIVENCRLADLPDLKQETVWVKKTLIQWIKDLIRNYKFDGIRIDTIPEVPAWFWSEFSVSSGVFQIGEVFNSRVNYVANYQNYVDSVFNYPLYYAMNNGFCKNDDQEAKDITGDMTEMHNYYIKSRQVFKDPTIMGLFLENHDNPRFMCHCANRIKFKNALALSFVYEGMPVYYYGAEQWFNGCNDPLDREPMWGHYDQTSELYLMVQKLNRFRKEQRLWEKNLRELAYNKQVYVFSRGKSIIFATANNDQENSIEFNTELPKNSKFCNVLGATDDCITVNQENKLLIQLKGEPKLYLLQK